MIGMPNPFVDVDSLEDAAKIAGFDMTAPDSLDGYNGTQIQAIKEDLIQVIYGEPDHNVYFRKAVGTEDISGDYNEYDTVTESDMDGTNITFSGNGELVYLASWIEDGRFCSVSMNEGAEKETMLSVVRSWRGAS